MADAFSEFVGLAKALTNLPDLDERWLDEVWHGADGNPNTAINHVLDGQKKRRPPAGPPGRAVALEPEDIVMDLSQEDPPEALPAPRIPAHIAVLRPGQNLARLDRFVFRYSNVPTSFERLVLSCIDAYFCNQIFKFDCFKDQIL